MTKSQIATIIENHGYTIAKDRRMPNGYGDMIYISNGCIVNIFDSGKISYQGKNCAEIQSIIEQTQISTIQANKKVFVVYGHDVVAKTQLEAMLRRWNLEPLILDQLGSSGMTIIEKLEEYISQAQFGIVLATPDDIGHPKDKEDEKKYRVRQNVVLELGMLLAKLGRSKVAILLKNDENMERPSDIQGLIYIPFTNDVKETIIGLVKELSNNGYTIDNRNL